MYGGSGVAVVALDEKHCPRTLYIDDFSPNA